MNGFITKGYIQYRFIIFSIVVLAVFLSILGTVRADRIHIAVCTNFATTAKEISEIFEEETSHETVLSVGSTGKLFSQIINGAPFHIFLAADEKHPHKAEEKGLAIAGTRFTYAQGRLALYSRNPTLIDNKGQILAKDRFFRLAIASPKISPYGAAALEVMNKLGVWNKVSSRTVYGNNIAQTYQFVMTANAQLGFVAVSQITNNKSGSVWFVPTDLYTPIRQEAILLTAGSNHDGAKAFLTFLKKNKARAVIVNYGYR